MWDWLIEQGYFSPLNNVEELNVPSRFRLCFHSGEIQ